MRRNVIKSVTTYREVGRGHRISYMEPGKPAKDILVTKAYKWENDFPQLPDYIVIEGVEDPGLTREVKCLVPADERVGVYSRMTAAMIDAYGL